jgi:uncharacterized protein GlcG (DUF336 family)
LRSASVRRWPSAARLCAAARAVACARGARFAAGIRAADHQRAGQDGRGRRLAEAKKNNWRMAFSIVGPAGELVYFERWTAPRWRRPTSPTARRAPPRLPSPDQDLRGSIRGGQYRVHDLSGTPGGLEGGVPITVNGKIVGAIGAAAAPAAGRPGRGRRCGRGEIAAAAADAPPASHKRIENQDFPIRRGRDAHKISASRAAASAAHI